jgi:hypothetical protein
MRAHPTTSTYCRFTRVSSYPCTAPSHSTVELTLPALPLAIMFAGATDAFQLATTAHALSPPYATPS